MPGAQEALALSFLPSFLPWLDSKCSGQEACDTDAKVFREVGSNEKKSSQQYRGREVGEAYGLWLTGEQAAGSEGQAHAAGPKTPWPGRTREGGAECCGPRCSQALTWQKVWGKRLGKVLGIQGSLRFQRTGWGVWGRGCGECTSDTNGGDGSC